jgi:hypothetical protein
MQPAPNVSPKSDQFFSGFHTELITRSVKENMTILCNKFFPNELAALQNSLTNPA